MGEERILNAEEDIAEGEEGRDWTREAVGPCEGGSQREPLH